MKKVIYILAIIMLLGGVAYAEVSQTNIEKDKFQQKIEQQKFNIHSEIGRLGSLNGNGFISAFENLFKIFMRLSLPESLDKLFIGSVPETPSGQFIGEMFGLADPFEGIIVDVQQKDMTNAKANFQKFKSQYQKVSTMVPEWEGYYNINDVNQLGKDIDNNNVPAIFQDVGKIGESCSRCHGNEMPQVWAKYYWKDFDSVNVSTPNGPVPWVVGMSQYLDTGYSGIGVNIRENKPQEAIKSFNLFKTMMLNFKQACNNCHNTPRLYYVSNDVMSQIDKMGTDLRTGKLADAEQIRRQLGDNCIRCHVLHIPAQDMKSKMLNN